jgi:antitoxin VapB
MTGILIARVIEVDGAQLVTLPRKASFPEDLARVNIRVQGCERIISPVQNTWNEFFLNGPKVSDDFMNLNQYLLK